MSTTRASDRYSALPDGETLAETVVCAQEPFKDQELFLGTFAAPPRIQDAQSNSRTESRASRAK